MAGQLFSWHLKEAIVPDDGISKCRASAARVQGCSRAMENLSGQVGGCIRDPRSECHVVSIHTYIIYVHIYGIHADVYTYIYIQYTHRLG